MKTECTQEDHGDTICLRGEGMEESEQNYEDNNMAEKRGHEDPVMVKVDQKVRLHFTAVITGYCYFTVLYCKFAVRSRFTLPYYRHRQADNTEMTLDIIPKDCDIYYDPPNYLGQSLC